MVLHCLQLALGRTLWAPLACPCAACVQAWFAKVAPVVKSYAPNQLITTGIDGFYQASTPIGCR